MIHRAMTVTLSSCRDDGTEDEAPIVHRLAILYLTLPLAIWLCGWFEWWFGIPALVLVAVSLSCVCRGPWRPRFSVVWLAIGLVALVWVLVLPSGGLSYAVAGNWPTYRALLLDLVDGDWPTYLPDANNEAPLVRYYLGYYMVPALLGKWFGAAALDWAVPAWTWIGFALVLALFVRPARVGLDGVGRGGAWAIAGATLTLLLFEGLDWLLSLFPPTSLDGWLRPYHSIPEMAEMPQHFITAGLATLLMAQLRGQRRFLAASGVVLAICTFWSTLLAIGLLPFAGALVVANGIRPFLTWQNLLCAPALVGIVGLYLATGDVNFPHGWLWEAYEDAARLAADVALLYLGEFALLALLVLRLRPALARDPVFWASLAVLAAAPWWWYGGLRFFNEASRVVVPALVVLNFYAAHALTALPAARRERTYGRWIAWLGLVGVLCAGSAPAAIAFLQTGIQVAKALADFRFVKHESLALSLVFRNVGDIRQRTGSDVGGLLAAVLRDNPEKGGQFQPLFRSAVRPLQEVWRHGDRLWFVTRRRGPADPCRKHAFVLRAWPSAGADAKLAAGHHEVLDFVSRHTRDVKAANNCIWMRRLPPYAVDRLLVGAVGGRRWMVELLFDGRRHAATNVLLDVPTGPFQTEHAALVATGPPAASGEWDVYLLDNTIAYAKAPCAWADTALPFFLHLDPADANDLPEWRAQWGFDNLDFHFDEHGVWFDDKCLIKRELPDYAIRLVTTGQFFPTAQGVSVPFRATPTAEQAAGAWTVEVRR